MPDPLAPVTSHDLDALLRGPDPSAALRALLERGDHLAAAGELDLAAQSYDALAQGVLDRVAHLDDTASREVLRGCVEGLGRCLASGETPRETRRRALRAVVDVLDGDPEGHAAERASDLLLEHSLPEERATVAAWLRALGDDEDLPADESSETPWDRIRHAHLIFDLVVDEMPEAAFARACRLLGRDAQLCEHYLVFGRNDEALAVARSVELSGLPAVAEVLARHGLVDEVARIIDARTARDDAPSVRRRAMDAIASIPPAPSAEDLLRRVDALFARGSRACDREAAATAHLALRAMTPAEGAAWLKSLRQRHIGRRAVREALDRAGLSSAQ